MTKTKDTIRSVIIAALLIALMALALIGAFGVVTVNAEESSSAATFDFPAATKFIGEGDTYTVNYYSPDGTKIAEQIVPYMSTVPMIVGCEDYSVVYDIAIPEEDNVFSCAGVEGGINDLAESVSPNTLSGYSINFEGNVGAVIQFTATENIKLEATVDDQSLVMDHGFYKTSFGHITVETSGSTGVTSISFEGVLDPSTIMISSLSVDGVELIHNNIATIPVDILYRTSNIDVVNLIVNDYDGGEVDFLNFSTKFVSGTTESVTVNFLSPDLKPISSTTITADQTLPVLAGYGNYTMIQKIPYQQANDPGLVVDGLNVDEAANSDMFCYYGSFSNNGVLQVNVKNVGSAFENNTISIDFLKSGKAVHFMPTVENNETVISGNQFTFLADQNIFVLMVSTARLIQYPNFELNSFVIDGYEYIRDDGLMQFPYTASELAGFTPNTDVINLIVDDYVAPEPEQPDDDPAPTPGGDTGEIDDPENPTVTEDRSIWQKIGDWFKNGWNDVVAWFENVGETIKNWFDEVGQWFKDLFN